SWVFVRQQSPAPSIVYTGNDGGIWRSIDKGATWTGTGASGAPPTINAGGLQTTLFYHLDISHDAAASVTLGALQDNGIVQASGPPVWSSSTCCDGVDVAFDAVITNEAYGVVNADVFESTDSGASFPTEIARGHGIPDT